MRWFGPGQSSNLPRVVGHASFMTGVVSALRQPTTNNAVARAHRRTCSTARLRFALTNPGDKDIRMQLNGYGAIGKLKIGGGWLGRRVETVFGCLARREVGSVFT